MPIKDSVLAWFVKEYLIPRAQVLDKPGFVSFNVSGKNPMSVRQVIIPEILFINLEKKCSETMGDEGKELLYSIGKKFGYSFATMGSFLTKKETDEKKLLDYIKLINKFIEGTYASLIDSTTDYQKSKITFYLKNFVVCNKVGYGFFLPLGAGTGLAAKLMDDNTIEGIQLQCQGQGKEQCIIVCAPPKILEEEHPNKKFFRETNLNGLEIPPHYQEFNKQVEIKSSNYSFKTYLDSGLFAYDHGIVTYKNYRYFIYEVTGLYLLSVGFEKNKKTEKIVFDSAFDAGKEIITEFQFENKNLESLIDLLTAFGWGDINIHKMDDKVLFDVKHFPWTRYSEQSSFALFRGFFSGILSGFANRPILLKVFNKNMNNDFFELILSE